MNACKGCKDRWVDAKSGRTCHSTCERYKAFIEQNEKRKKQIANSRDLSKPYREKKKYQADLQSKRYFDKKRREGK